MPDEPTGCLGLLLRLFGRSFDDGRDSGGGGDAMPRVMVSTKFVSPAEANFFRVIRTVVGNRGHVLAQVALNRLLFLPGSERTDPGRSAWANKIARRSLDFVVCDPATLRPLVAIELDDETHATPSRQTRDDEVERLLQAAGLPLVHVLPSRTYDTRELDVALAPHLAPVAPPPPRDRPPRR